MKKFVDLNLRLPIAKPDRRKVEELIKRSAELGYSSIGVPIPIDADKGVIQGLDRICNENNLDLIRRVDLNPTNVRGLLRSLRTVRRKREVIAVQCVSKSVSRQAARDHRVDLISFPSIDPRKRFFDSAEAELALNASAALEVDMAPLLVSIGFRRVRLISYLRKEVAIAKKFNVPIIMSSGAADKYLLRKPQDYSSLAYLFDLDHQAAIKALSEAALNIVERNRQKLNPNYVAPGVYIVRRGKDCQQV